MYVKLVYKLFDAQQQEETYNLKRFLHNFLYLENKGSNICHLNLDLETYFFKPYYWGLITSSWIKSDITLYGQL